ncbi:hypothetical protein FKM82_029198 [Ascaphus truei]
MMVPLPIGRHNAGDLNTILFALMGTLLAAPFPACISGTRAPPELPLTRFVSEDPLPTPSLPTEVEGEITHGIYDFSLLQLQNRVHNALLAL